MQALVTNIRYALRALARRPGYALISIAVLAIAIGANTTVFSVLNAFLLRPLPFAESDRLVMVYDSYPKIGLEVAGTAIPDYLERRAQAKSLEDLAIVTTTSRTLGGEGAPEQITIARASPSLFNVLRVSPALGRFFGDNEAVLGNERVAVLSHTLWTTRFGARPDAIGRDIRLDGETLRVIGVLPDGFSFAGDVAAWVPFAFTPQEASDAGRGRQFSFAIGRLKSGATVAGLNAELAAIVQRNVAAGIVPRSTIDASGFTGKAQPLRTFQVGNLEAMLFTLQATVLAVLLIACANVANLQLARAAARRKELAVRAALGAGTGRLARLVLLESLVLALFGAALGLAVAEGGLELVHKLGLQRPGIVFELDVPVLAFTLGSAVFAALVSALPPVIALTRDDLSRSVQEAGRLGGAGRRTQSLRSALVVAQVAMSVALLAGAGMLTKSFLALQEEGTGFNPTGVWSARILLPRTRYAEPESWPRLETQALESLRALPGVGAAGFTSSLPFSGNNNQGSLAIEGYVPQGGATEPHAQSWIIDEQYLRALEMPLLAGRNFTATEGERVAIVDTNLARKYWPGGSALGHRLRMAVDGPDQWYTIIGVVSPVKAVTIADDPTKETVYWHFQQRRVVGGAFVLRTALPPEQLTRVATAAIANLDPELALFNAQSMNARIESSLGPQRTPMVLTLVFAAVAFGLAVIGVYGVLSWTVAQRLGEIGLRVALGARTGDIVQMVLVQGGRLVAVGAALGFVGAIGIGFALAAQIRNVRAFDPAVLGVAVFALAAAALIASWVPARRAAGTDPMIALRTE